ncbi:protein-cysteine N-palmitoyltransferase HHAT [Lingula anatina]|uniref:Protein-cysteine N-palmitoyltransferase HHAT n=1 Tax=Lingula anatina TaxID=7574 RepID=A0A1S3K216_LINAN|nr:protein-cysteine N-palmitoyltransferase HHAT [Lingula anatina]|eukprot:XP_013416439.1 protein-cysteine N-palmitoyltransferase HHAT [Lingula anatina]
MGISTLPVWEITVYWVCWLSAVVYITENTILASIEFRKYLSPYDIRKGWTVLGTTLYKDVSNFEWEFWFSAWGWIVLPCYIGHGIIGSLVNWKCRNLRKQFFVLYTVGVVWYVMGLKQLLILLLHCAISFVTAMSGSSVLVWIVCLLLLATLNHEVTVQWLRLAVDDDVLETKYYLFVFTIAMTNLRYISFCLEKAKSIQFIKSQEMITGESVQKQKMPHREDAALRAVAQNCNFMDMMTYVFYFPLFFTGPILTYDKFLEQVNRPPQPWTKPRITHLALDFVRITWWLGFNYLLLHVVHLSAIQLQLDLLSSLPLWTLGGVAFWNFQFFQTKYVVMFGLPSCFAKLDQMEPPAGPICISHLYLFSTMWQQFDRGLYQHLKRHIYIPLGGSRHGLFSQLLATAACFIFVYYWHGNEVYLAWWSILNFTGVVMEVIGRKTITSEAVQRMMKKHWSPSWQRRFLAALLVPNFIFCSMASLVFVGGSDAGKIYFRRLIFGDWPTSAFMLSAVVYCIIQVAIEIDSKSVKKDKET